MSETSDEVSLTVFKKKLGNFLFIGANETILRKKNQLQRRTEKLPYIFLAKMKEQALPSITFITGRIQIKLLNTFSSFFNFKFLLGTKVIDRR